MKPHLPDPEAIFPSRSPLIAAGEPSFSKMEDPMNRAKPFEAPPFALRHGSADKVPHSRFAELGKFLEISCPDCGAVLCVDISLLSLAPDFDCSGCGETIAL
jgi:ribosomal protein S27E